MELSIICPINDLSYGIVGTHIVDELVKLGHNISLFPIGQPSCELRYSDNIRLSLSNADKFSISCPCIRLFHQFDLSMFVGKGTHIGFPIFELDTFTEKEQHHLKSCDELFVCSKWAKGIICNHLLGSPLRTNVVPLGVDTEVFTPKLSTRKPTIFLNIGKWEVRKGHDVLVDMFNSAFSETDSVELWMMNNNPFYTNAEQKGWENRYRDSKLGDKIRILPHVETSDQVAEIMQQADCGVFPSRGEGWGLENLEMLSCGKDIITTNYSAHTEFCTQENSLLVPITEVESAYDGKWFFRQGNWAKIGKDQIEQFIHCMKWIHMEKQSGHLGINEEGVNTAQRFTWKNTAETIIRHLS